MNDKVQELADHGPVVFYDGECGLCDWSVKRLIKMDKGHTLRYATLQGETAREAIGEPQGAEDGWSIKLLDSSGVYERSTAALRAMVHAGGIWKMLGRVGLFVPTFIRDRVYRWIAKNRFRWFGRRKACMVPSPALRERFLP